jgi:hypothetical protein
MCADSRSRECQIGGLEHFAGPARYNLISYLIAPNIQSLNHQVHQIIGARGSEIEVLLNL